MYVRVDARVVGVGDVKHLAWFGLGIFNQGVKQNSWFAPKAMGWFTAWFEPGMFDQGVNSSWGQTNEWKRLVSGSSFFHWVSSVTCAW